MTSQLASQLRILSGHSVDQRQTPKYASFLFDARQAADLDLDTIHKLGINGLEELRKKDPKFSEFEGTLFSTAGANYDRELQSQQSINKLNESIGRFLNLLSPYFLLPAAHKSIEYLIRRFEIHIYNSSQIIESFIPFHETATFARLLQLIRIPDTCWKFLQPYQRSGSIIDRKLIVQACLNDSNLLKYIFDISLKATLNSSKNQIGRLNKVAISFTTAILFEIISVNIANESFIRKLCEYLNQGFTSKCEEFQISSYMIFGYLSSLTSIDHKLLSSLITSLIQGIDIHDSQSSIHRPIYCCALVFEHQNILYFPDNAFRFLIKIEALIPTLNNLINEEPDLSTNIMHSIIRSFVTFFNQHVNYRNILSRIIEEIPLQHYMEELSFLLLEKLHSQIIAKKDENNYQEYSSILRLLAKMYLKEVEKSTSKFLKKSSQNKKEIKSLKITISTIFDKSFLQFFSPSGSSDSNSDYTLMNAISSHNINTRCAALHQIIDILSTENENTFLQYDIIKERLNIENDIECFLLLLKISKILNPNGLLSSTVEFERISKVLEINTDISESKQTDKLISNTIHLLNYLSDSLHSLPSNTVIQFLLHYMIPNYKIGFKQISLLCLKLLSNLQIPLFLVVNFSNFYSKLLIDVKDSTSSEYINILVDKLSYLSISNESFFIFLINFLKNTDNKYQLPILLLMLNKIMFILSKDSDNYLSYNVFWSLSLEILIEYSENTNDIIPASKDINDSKYYDKKETSEMLHIIINNKKSFPAIIIRTSFLNFIRCFPKKSLPIYDQLINNLYIFILKHFFSVEDAQFFQFLISSMFSIHFTSPLPLLHFLLNQSWRYYSIDETICYISIQLLNAGIQKMTSSLTISTYEICSLIPDTITLLTSESEMIRNSVLSTVPTIINLITNLDKISSYKLTPFYLSLLRSIADKSEELKIDLHSVMKFFHTFFSSYIDNTDVLNAWLSVGQQYNNENFLPSRIFTFFSCIIVKSQPHSQFMQKCFELLHFMLSRTNKTIDNIFERSLFSLLLYYITDSVDENSFKLLCECLYSDFEGHPVDHIPSYLELLKAELPLIELNSEWSLRKVSVCLISHSSFNNHSIDNQLTIFEILCSIAFTGLSDQTSNPLDEARNKLSEINVSSDLIIQDIQKYFTPNPLKFNIYVLYSILEYIYSDFSKRSALIPILFKMLDKILHIINDFKNAEEFIVLIDRLILINLMTSIRIFEYNFEIQNQLESFHNLDIRPVVYLIRSNHISPLTRTHALKLLSVSVPISPISIVDIITDAFAFSELKNDSSLSELRPDSYSFTVIHQTILSIIPPILATGKLSVFQILDHFFTSLPLLDIKCCYPLLSALSKSLSHEYLHYIIVMLSIYSRSLYEAFYTDKSVDFKTTIFSIDNIDSLYFKLFSIFNVSQKLICTVNLIKLVGLSLETIEKDFSDSNLIKFNEKFSSNKSWVEEIHVIIRKAVYDSIFSSESEVQDQVFTSNMNIHRIITDIFYTTLYLSDHNIFRSYISLLSHLFQIIPVNEFNDSITNILGSIDKDSFKSEKNINKIEYALLLVCKRFTISSWQSNASIEIDKSLQLLRLFSSLLDILSNMEISKELHEISCYLLTSSYIILHSSTNTPGVPYASDSESEFIPSIAIDKPSYSTNISPEMNYFLTNLLSLLCKTLTNVMNSTHNISINIIEYLLSLITLIIETINLDTTPYFPSFFPSSITILENCVRENHIFNKHSNLLIRDLLLIRTCMRILPQFANPYLLKLFQPFFLLNTNSQFIAKLRNDIIDSAIVIPARLLLPPLFECFDFLTKNNINSDVSIKYFGFIENIINLMRHEAVSIHHKSIMSFFLRVFDFRHQMYIIYQSIDPSVEIIEHSSIQTFISLTLKLSETQFSPFYEKMSQWIYSNDSSDKIIISIELDNEKRNLSLLRAITFFKLTNRLSNSLKTVFFPFYSVIWDNSISILNIMINYSDIHPNKKVKTKKHGFKRNDIYKIEWLWDLFDNVLESFTNYFHLFSSQNDDIMYTTEQPVSSIGLLCSLVEYSYTFLSNLPDKQSFQYITFIETRLGPCITELASLLSKNSSLNKDQLKEITTLLLQQTRNNIVPIRLASIKIISMIIARIGEDFVVLLPDVLAYLNELFEDSNDEVESAARSLKLTIDSTLGESSITDIL